MLLSLLLLSGSAKATTFSVEICIKFNISLGGVAGTDVTPRDDFWDDNLPHKNARGVKLVISDHGTGTYIFDDFVDDESGCIPNMDFDDNSTYSFQVFSEAEVNGLGVEVYSDDSELYLYDTTWLPWYPGQNPSLDFPTKTWYVPAGYGSSTSEAFAALAVTTWAFNRNTFGVTPGTVAKFQNHDCCNATAARIRAASATKSAIGHELGHWVAANLFGNPNKNYLSPQNGCDGDLRTEPEYQVGHHAVGTKEWQSAAVVEGFADFYNAWLWNKKTESDCMYYMGYGTDFDLDGNVDASLYSCETVPVPGLPSWVSGHDWLEDAVDGSIVCNAPLSNKGTEYDWMRFFWDMMTDEGLGPVGVVNLYGLMSPSTFDANGSTPLITTDDPTVRLQLACANMGVTSSCENQEHNGQDH